ncbi:hypothetical protein Dsin_014409 [Dipteronia sinensis]|uniref:Uncharacterized protein n=1 Tax=Dipteronia sinensis TaxID=43782 RepID=A0AAE0AN23_9ROSI|nr:hypothetical protein Dsin_014409 [Dipteronia sinensis]
MQGGVFHAGMSQLLRVKALSNMPIIDEKLDENVRTVYLEESRVMSTYLVAVVVGLFDNIEDTTADDGIWTNGGGVAISAGAAAVLFVGKTALHDKLGTAGQLGGGVAAVVGGINWVIIGRNWHRGCGLVGDVVNILLLLSSGIQLWGHIIIGSLEFLGWRLEEDYQDMCWGYLDLQLCSLWVDQQLDLDITFVLKRNL